MKNLIKFMKSIFLEIDKINSFIYFTLFLSYLLLKNNILNNNLIQILSKNKNI